MAQSRHALGHLAGGLVGEGDRQNRRRRHALGDDVGDAARDNARLAATGPGQHQQWPVNGGDGLALRGCKAVEKRIGDRHVGFGRKEKIGSHGCGRKPLCLI